jgi:hypothetical protein
MKATLDSFSGSSPYFSRFLYSRPTHSLKLATSSSLVISASGIFAPMPVIATRFMPVPLSGGRTRECAPMAEDDRAEGV